MIEIILKENILSDNILRIAEKNEIFRNNIVAIIYEHTYLNAWNDKQTIKKFKKISTLEKWLTKHYSHIDLNEYLINY